MARTLLHHCCLLGCLLLTLVCRADKPVTPPENEPQPIPVVNQYAIDAARSGSRINWQTGQLEAVGIGYVTEKGELGKRQARATAMTIMVHEARKGLTGLQVDATTTLAIKTPEQKRLADAVVAHLVVIDEIWTGRTCAVVGALPLYGEYGAAPLAAKALASAKPIEVNVNDLTLLPTIPRGHTPQANDGPYTGVIINLDGGPLASPCLFPRLLRFDGKEVWGPSMVKPDALANGPVRYVPNLNAALAHKLAGENPLILQSVGVGQGYHPVLNVDDVYLLLTEHKFKGLLNTLPLVYTLGQP